MNRGRLKEALRTAREQSKLTWRSYGHIEMVSLPLPIVNTLIKAATKELNRS